VRGTKPSVLVNGKGIPLGTVIAAANTHDSPLLRPTLEELYRFGFHLPPNITVPLDAGYDSVKTRDLLGDGLLPVASRG
jgi:Transposase DDE domain